MRHAVVGLILLLCLAAPLFAGEDVKELRAELRKLDGQFRAAQYKARNNENIRELNKAVGEAYKALKKAESEIAEIKEVDDKLKDIDKQRRTLMKQRVELSKKHAEALSEPRKAIADARAAVTKGISELPGMQELSAKRTELQQKLRAAGGGKRQPGKRTPRKKLQGPRNKTQPRPEADGN